MEQVFLVKEGGKVLAFYSEAKLQDAGYSIADKIVSDETFASNGGYARVLGNEIIVGFTQEEQAQRQKEKRLEEINAELVKIDASVGPRPLRDIALAQKKSLGTAVAKAVENIERAEGLAGELRAERAALAEG